MWYKFTPRFKLLEVRSKVHRSFFQMSISFLSGATVLCLLMLAGLSAPAWHAKAARQDQEKAFQKLLPRSPEPVVLVEIKTANQTIRFPDEVLALTIAAAKRDIPARADKWSVHSSLEASFKQAPAIKIKDFPSVRPFIEVQAADRVDWLRGTTFKLKNQSGKNIHRINLELWFPDTEFPSPMMAFPVISGRIPNVADDQREPLLVKPNEEVTITIDDGTYSRLVRFLERRQPITTINKAEIHLTLVVFDDQTAWGDGEYLKQDPNNPRSFKKAEVKPPGN
jgi:hypothetical protein